MIMSGTEFEALMRRTQATPLTCWKCGTVFTFEEGGLAAIAADIHSADIHSKVMCTSCGAVYDTDVQFTEIALTLDGRTEVFPTP